LRLVDTLDDVVFRLFATARRTTDTHPQTVRKPGPRLGPAQQTKLGKDGKTESPALEPKTTRRPGTP
jgi:hypothetical protein